MNNSNKKSKLETGTQLRNRMVEKLDLQKTTPKASEQPKGSTDSARKEKLHDSEMETLEMYNGGVFVRLNVSTNEDVFNDTEFIDSEDEDENGMELTKMTHTWVNLHLNLIAMSLIMLHIVQDITKIFLERMGGHK